MSESRSNQGYGFIRCREQGWSLIVQPVYQDEYGILKLSSQPVGVAEASEVLKPSLWRMLLKPWCLFKMHAAKSYPACQTEPKNPKASL